MDTICLCDIDPKTGKAKKCKNYGQILPGGPDCCPDCGQFSSLAPQTALQGVLGQREVIKEIGRGGMGAVYLVKDSQGHLSVVKQFFNDTTPANAAINRDNRNRFKREADNQQLVAHPAFAKGFGWWEENGKLFMEMEYVQGNTWNDEISSSPNGKMDLLKSLEIAIQVASALDYLHNMIDPQTNTLLHLVHRDIKPENVMIMPSGKIKVLDLGIARPADLSKAKISAGATLVLGTGEFVPPEQLGIPGIGGKNLVFDGRADQYALAASLYFSLSGQKFNNPAFGGGWKGRENQVRKDIKDIDVQGVIRKAISIDPDDRYPTARDFGKALADVYTLHAPLPSNLTQFVHNKPATQVFTFSGTGLFTPNPASTLAPHLIPPTPILPTPTPRTLTPNAPILATPSFDPKLVKIEVNTSKVKIISATEYERTVRGRVTFNGSALPNVIVRPEIIEVGGSKNGTGTEIKTGPGGDFVLDVDDYRVPLTVESREIRLLVLDNAGVEICNDRPVIKIKRPWSYTRQANIQRAKNAGTYVPFYKRALKGVLIGLLIGLILALLSLAVYLPWLFWSSIVNGFKSVEWTWWLIRAGFVVGALILAYLLYRFWSPILTKLYQAIGLAMMIVFLLLTIYGVANDKIVIWWITAYLTYMGWNLFSLASQQRLDETYKLFKPAWSIIFIGIELSLLYYYYAK